jgi:hypothetical protein
MDARENPLGYKMDRSFDYVSVSEILVVFRLLMEPSLCVKFNRDV